MSSNEYPSPQNGAEALGYFWFLLGYTILHLGIPPTEKSGEDEHHTLALLLGGVLLGAALTS